MCIHQAEGVVCIHELFYAVLLKHHDVVQVGAALMCAVLTVNHICLSAVVLASHKQQIENLHLWREKPKKHLRKLQDKCLKEKVGTNLKNLICTSVCYLTVWLHFKTMSSESLSSLLSFWGFVLLLYLIY